MSLSRPLRLLTYLATAIALPLNIAATVVSLHHQRHRWARRHATAFCFSFIPLAMTVVASSIALKQQGKSLRFTALDLVAALGYLGVLVPCWTLEIKEFDAGGFGLLAGYATGPMILNMFIHVYFILNEVPYKKLLTTLSLWKRSSAGQQCPNCQSKFVAGTAETTKKGYSLLRGEKFLNVEADLILYRDSEDFLREGAEQAEQPGKGKDMMEV